MRHYFKIGEEIVNAQAGSRDQGRIGRIKDIYRDFDGRMAFECDFQGETFTLYRDEIRPYED